MTAARRAGILVEGFSPLATGSMISAADVAFLDGLTDTATQDHGPIRRCRSTLGQTLPATTRLADQLLVDRRVA